MEMLGTCFLLDLLKRKNEKLEQKSIKFQSAGRDYSSSNWAFSESITSTNQSTTGDSEEFVRDIATDSSGNAYIIGYFESTTISFGSITLTNYGGTDVYVAKISPSGTWQWAYSAGSDGDDVGSGIAVKSNSIYITGHFTTSISFGNNTLTDGWGYEVFVFYMPFLLFG